MSLQIGDTAPDFEAETTEGKIHFHDWIGDSWAVLFSHPKDFTPVCTTELGYMARIKPEFDKRNVKIIGLSVDPADKHEAWAKDIEETQGTAPNYPIIADPEYKVSMLYGMLPGGTTGDPAQRTPMHNVSTPVNWKPGEDVIISGTVSNDEAKELFGEWQEPKPYIRIVPDPAGAGAR